MALIENGTDMKDLRHILPADGSAHLLIGGDWTVGEGAPFDVLDKFRLTPVATLASATREQASRMVEAADTAFRAGGPSPVERGRILDRAAALLADEAEQVAAVIQLESGFTRSDAKGEVTRCLETLRLSAEEARRLAGEVVPIGGAPGQDRRFAFTLRVPLGVVLAITPFNSPLNTVAHKIAPAFAAGNAVIVKPASSTPMTTLRLADILVRAGMPKGFLSVLLGPGRLVEPVIEDERVRFIAFTGSTAVGRRIQSKVGLRRSQMELGSISYTILCHDADLETALPKIVGASYRKAGQVCTSVQVALVHRSRLDEVSDRLTASVREVRFGDPSHEGTLTGPLISEAEALRVEDWIAEACDEGAERLVGGERDCAVIPPTLMTNVTTDMRIVREEVFGPVLSLMPFDDVDEAIALANATPYGLAAGVFTNRMDDAFKFARRLEVGGVHVNETSSSRVDLMPYGGTKNSGFGREGPRYAVHEMTEERIVTIRT